jgi:hypothetical protein
MPVFIDPSSGERYESVPDEDAERARSEFGLVTEREYQLEQQYGDRGGRAFLNSAAAGAIDAAVAPVRLTSELAQAAAGGLGAEGVASELGVFNQQIQGRQVLENLNAVLGELTGQGNAEAVGRRYADEARAIAEANPNWSTAGYVGGQLAGGVASGLTGAASQFGKAAASAATSSALGRSAFGLAAEGAAEGAILASGEAGEQAYIRNEKLTSEQMMAAIGMGTLIGGGAGGTLGTLGHGAGAVYRSGARAADAAGERLRKVFGPRTTASAETVAEVASQGLGVNVTKAEGGRLKTMLESLRDKAEETQSAVTDARLDDLQAVGAGRWDSNAIKARDAYANRDAIRDQAKADLHQGLQAFTDAAEPVVDEIRYNGLKLEHIRQNVTGDAGAQLAEARAQADKLEQMLTPMRKPGSAAKAQKAAGKAEPIDRESFVASFDELERDAIDDELDAQIREALEELGEDTAEGTRKWTKMEQSILRDRVEAASRRATPEARAAGIDPNEGRLRGELGSPAVLDEIESFVARNVAAIRKTDDPAVAYSLLDQTKRAAQKYADKAGRSAEALTATSPERALLARKRSDYLERFQEPLRQSLENAEVWGKQGVNQRAINAAVTRHMEGKKAFDAQFISRSSGYRGLGVQRQVREEATRGFVNRFGLAENQANEQFLRAQLRSTLDVLSAIDGALELGEKKALVAQAKATSEQLGSMLDGLGQNVRDINRVERLVKADGEDGAMSKTLIGSLIGGPMGAAIGAVADVALSPGKQIRQAIAVQRMARRLDIDIEKGIDRVFGQGKKVEAKRAAAAAPTVDVTGVANDVDDLADEADEISGVRAIPTEPGAPPPAAGARRGRASTAAAASVPLAMVAFMGGRDDKQAAFKERAQQIHAATANMGEHIRGVVDSDMGDVAQDFPRLGSALVNGMTRGALFLESKLPQSYRAAAPGAIGRSTRPVADHDIAKFARYWGAVNSPVSVLQDMALGIVTDEQIEAVRTVYPELHVKLTEKLLERAAEADAAGERLPMQTRLQLGRFAGVQIEPAFRSSVLDLLDQVRQERDQQQPRPSNPPNLAASTGPESMQIQQRASSVAT